MTFWRCLLMKMSGMNVTCFNELVHGVSFETTVQKLNLKKNIHISFLGFCHQVIHVSQPFLGAWDWVCKSLAGEPTSAHAPGALKKIAP